jgi:hypothetical protein
MQVEHDNFVGIYDGVFSSEFCQNLINHFEWCQSNNRTYGRIEAQHLKDDQAVNLNPTSPNELSFISANIPAFIGEFSTGFWDTCYADYRKAYSVIDQSSQHTIFTYKVQKTLPGGGYHIWHCEDAAKEHMNRLGVYILYLNDVDEGGETEFLYLHKRVKPKRGRLVIFPPNYPWAHRGNPPLSGVKYILTGWTEFS